jgi:hypothetical protein
MKQSAVRAPSGGGKFVTDIGKLLPDYTTLYVQKLEIFVATALRALLRQALDCVL